MLVSPARCKLAIISPQQHDEAAARPCTVRLIFMCVGRHIPTCLLPFASLTSPKTFLSAYRSEVDFSPPVKFRLLADNHCLTFQRVD